MWPSATVDSVMKQQEINLDFSRRQVMTIVNVTPDSFSPAAARLIGSMSNAVCAKPSRRALR